MSRLTVVRFLDWLVLAMALVIGAALIAGIAWNMWSIFTGYGFPHGRWHGSPTRTIEFFIPGVLILQGLSLALFSREHSIISEQRLARLPWMRRLGADTHSPRAWRWLGFFQLAAGLLMIAVYIGSRWLQLQ